MTSRDQDRALALPEPEDKTASSPREGGGSEPPFPIVGIDSNPLFSESIGIVAGHVVYGMARDVVRCSGGEEKRKGGGGGGCVILRPSEFGRNQVARAPVLGLSTFLAVLFGRG